VISWTCFDRHKGSERNFPDFFFPGLAIWVFNSGFSPLPGDHMVHAGVGGIGQYGTLA